MIRVDEEALVCDLAETYGIFNYRSLPSRTVAILACGLRNDSRIKMKLSGEPASTNTILLARLVDLLTAMLYAEGSNRPQSIVEKLYNIEPQEKKEKVITFDSGEDFLDAWRKHTEGRQ